MNWLDLLLIAILLFSTVMAARKGFSREVIGLLAASAAFIFGMWFYGSAGSLVAPYTGSQRIANLIGFFLVVIGVLVCGALVGRVVNRFLYSVGLSSFDRILGAAFGLLRGLFVAMALLTAFMAFGPHAETNAAPVAVVHSRIAPYVLEASHYFVAMAPMNLKQNFRKHYAQVKSAWQKTAPQHKNEEL